jgi:probable phosphoglycerate mutase
MDLLLVRHALPVRIDDGDAPADPPLDERGHEQARALAAWLREEPISHVYTSPMRRARETAEPLAGALGIEAVVDDELAEFDRDSHFYIPIEELRATKDQRWLDMVAGSWGDNAEVDPAVFREVVVGAVERVVAAHPGSTVAIVAHGGVINAYLAHVIGIDRPLFFEPGYTSISRVLASRRGDRQVRSINETAHVRGLL